MSGDLPPFRKESKEKRSHSTVRLFTFVGLQFALMIWRSSSKNCTIGVLRAWSARFEITHKIVYNQKTKNENKSPWKNTCILWAWYSPSNRIKVIGQKKMQTADWVQSGDCRLSAISRLRRKTCFSLSTSLANRSECGKEKFNYFSLMDVNLQKTTEAIYNLLHEVQLTVLRRTYFVLCFDSLITR